MKNILKILFLFSAISCASIKYNVAENGGNFSEVKVGEKYSVYDLQDRKSIISVTSVPKDSIIGTNKDQRISIAKKDIKDIVKNHTAATIILSAAAATLIIVSAIIVKGVKDTAEKIGNALPPL